MTIVIFIIILLVLVLIHEFGHFITAKKFGMRVDEFGFGFPPKLFSIKKGETEYSFNLLPIGGFVKILGENGSTEEVEVEDKRNFINQAKWKQAIVLFAGVFANFLMAWFLFSVGFMSGFPSSVGNAPEGYTIQDPALVVVSVFPDSPADVAGLKSGDKIVSIATDSSEVAIVNPQTLKDFVVQNSDQEIIIGYERGKEESGTLNMTPLLREGEEPMIGISMDQIGTLKLPFFRAIWEGLVLDLHVVKSTALGLIALLGGAFTGGVSLSAVTGPVGLVSMVGDAYSFGFVYLLSFTALISVNLAIINLIPIPALDGGRLLMVLIEKIKGSRINPKITNTVNTVGFFLLILLMIVITYNDIVRLF